jgi:hypothetical protein
MYTKNSQHPHCSTLRCRPTLPWTSIYTRCKSLHLDLFPWQETYTTHTKSLLLSQFVDILYSTLSQSRLYPLSFSIFIFFLPFVLRFYFVLHSSWFRPDNFAFPLFHFYSPLLGRLLVLSFPTILCPDLSFTLGTTRSISIPATMTPVLGYA